MEIILRMTTITLRVKILVATQRSIIIVAPAVDVVIPLPSRRVAALVRHLLMKVCN